MAEASATYCLSMRVLVLLFRRYFAIASCGSTVHWLCALLTLYRYNTLNIRLRTHHHHHHQKQKSLSLCEIQSVYSVFVGNSQLFGEYKFNCSLF